MTHDAQSMDLMRQARQKAAALLDNMLRRQQEMQASPPRMDAAALARGQHAIRHAADSARRTLDAIEQAM